MTTNEMWQIFKNTGSIEAYISYAQSKTDTEITDGTNREDKRDNSQNNRYTG